MLATFTVTNAADAPENTPQAVGTLRQAIFDANQLDDADTINFSTNPAHGLNGGTITLTEEELSISESVTIDATMLSLGLTIDASGTDPTPTVNNGDGTRIMSIRPNEANSITLAGLTITGGDLQGAGGGIFYSPLLGGGFGSLTIRDCEIVGNSASDGGAVFLGGSDANFNMVMSNCNCNTLEAAFSDDFRGC
jgi:hypothetical protein